MSFAYNDAGLRISKTANDVTTHYVYDGSLLAAEYTNNETIVYIYDAFDSPIGFAYRSSSYSEDTWDVYWYEKNLQGDTVAVYSSTGTKLVSYDYDAWGNFTTTYHNGGASTGAMYNKFTYRGYYYDSDLGLYYLQSRYYDPVICRFINADIPDVITASPAALTDKNLFAYCDNNPVMRVDENGEFWSWLVGAAVGAFGAALLAGLQEKKGRDFWGSVANGAVAGFVGGISADVLLVTGCTIKVAIIVGSVSGGIGNTLGNIVESMITNRKLNLVNILIDASFGAATGALFGAINGAQDSMMQVVINGAGKKALERGISFLEAAAKTSARELSKIGTSFVEESLTSFVSWFIQAYTEYIIGVEE